MNKKKTRFILMAAVAGWALLYAPPIMAQSVVFPQLQQAGRALSANTADSFTLSNDLFSASFTRKNGMLSFDGCSAMNLTPTTDLFKVVLGDGTTVKSSEMQLGTVKTVDLAADTDAAKGALRIPGKAIQAEFIYQNLIITWRAVLRDGSHYLRTEMDIKATADQPMTAILPMLYTVNTAAAGSTPAVVGNTRGAILASDKIFAGLETPMGINSVETPSAMEPFNAHAWTETSFSWQPGAETPKDILNLGFSASQIVGTRGYLSFTKAGENKVTFTYKSGTHRLNMVGVDVVDPTTGSVVASDYHIGYTGNNMDKNTYTLIIPKRGAYQLRYFMETKTETITSSGDITFDQKVKQPVIVYDLMTEGARKSVLRASRLAPAHKVLSGTTIGEDESLTDSWTPSAWKTVEQVPLRINELGFYNPDVKSIEQDLNITAPQGTFSVEFLYSSGTHKLNLVGMDLVDSDGNVATYDYHKGFTGGEKENNVYSVNIPYAGQYKLRYFAETKTEDINSSGSIKINLAVNDTIHLPAQALTPIEGKWSRNTTLKAGKTWNVGAVVGLIAPGQARRSILAYSERERAVPWRAYPVYISWYELNIDRNNAAPPLYKGNMTVDQCTDVVTHWYYDFYKKYNMAPKAFVWDDGWDSYGTWKFNPNFPNGFDEPAKAAARMGAGIGAWLGPVGGYGKSGDYRRQYWTNLGKKMELSNQEYYDFFVDACRYMVNTYDFRFFKYDGISAQFSATGPDTDAKGEENAEAIISIERDLRASRPDLFLNTTVGTWASPFWFQFTDAVWRQEQDYGEIGNQGTDREKWITYRDRLVYQNFVQRSPLCPINTLMTHGLILTKFGQVSKNMDYDGIVREMRCAFACGSGMVELYTDYSLMNSIENSKGEKGMLWKELADCMKWQQDYADVLPDIHWVGGNPWDGTKANVYGWAAWNGEKAVLTLRNPATYQQTYTTTLRQALEIPAFISTSVTLTNAFEQAVVSGLDTGKPIDIDTPISITLPASSVFVFNGTDNNPVLSINETVSNDKVLNAKDNRIYDLSGRQQSKLKKGLNIVGGKKVIKK